MWVAQTTKLFCVHEELNEASKPPTHCVSMHISKLCLTSCSSMCVGHEGRGCCVCQPAHPRSQTCIWWPVAGRCLGALCWRWSRRDRPQTSATYPEGGVITNWLLSALTLQTFDWIWKWADCRIRTYTSPTTEERNKLWSFLQFLTCVNLNIVHVAPLWHFCVYLILFL